MHEVIRKKDPRTILRVILEDDSFLEIFAVLSVDLVNAVRAEQTTGAGLRRCIDRLAMWQVLFERVPAEGLSEEAQRGLFGELAILENFCLAELDKSEAVSSWTGPDAAHQDFKIGGAAVEVKTTLKVRDVDHLIGLLRDAEEELPEYAERRIYGAVAYLKADESSAVYAERQGLFVIRATGNSASITNGPDSTPRTFGRRSTARAVGE